VTGICLSVLNALEIGIRSGVRQGGQNLGKTAWPPPGEVRGQDGSMIRLPVTPIRTGRRFHLTAGARHG